MNIGLLVGTLFFAAYSLISAWKNFNRYDTEGCLFNAVVDLVFLVFLFATKSDYTSTMIVSGILGMDLACYCVLKL